VERVTKRYAWRNWGYARCLAAHAEYAGIGMNYEVVMLDNGQPDTLKPRRVIH
jgi:hypothetical protein